jgi:hypothetical protein
MAAMGAGDYFYIGEWRITPTVLLKPAASPPSPPLLDQLKGLLSRGIIVRVLLWYLPSAALVLFYRLIPARRLNHAKDNIDFVIEVNKAAAGDYGPQRSGARSAPGLPFSLAPGRWRLITRRRSFSLRRGITLPTSAAWIFRSTAGTHRFYNSTATA